MYYSDFQCYLHILEENLLTYSSSVSLEESDGSLKHKLCFSVFISSSEVTEGEYSFSAGKLI